MIILIRFNKYLLPLQVCKVMEVLEFNVTTISIDQYFVMKICNKRKEKVRFFLLFPRQFPQLPSTFTLTKFKLMFYAFMIKNHHHHKGPPVVGRYRMHIPMCIKKYLD